MDLISSDLQRSPEISRDLQRSPEISRDLQRSPEISRLQMSDHWYLTWQAIRNYPWFMTQDPSRPGHLSNSDGGRVLELKDFKVATLQHALSPKCIKIPCLRRFKEAMFLYVTILCTFQLTDYQQIESWWTVWVGHCHHLSPAGSSALYEVHKLRQDLVDASWLHQNQLVSLRCGDASWRYSLAVHHSTDQWRLDALRVLEL